MTALSLALTSCGRPEGAQRAPFPPVKQEEEYSLSLSDDVMVDRAGYQADSVKLFMVTGEELPDTFRLLDQDTGEVVFTGELKEKGNVESGKEYNRVGDFSEWKQPGEYYIECDNVGYSETFSIGSNIYEKIFAQVLHTLVRQQEDFAREEDDTVASEKLQEQIDMAFLQLLSCELYPEAFETENAGSVRDVSSGGNSTAAGAVTPETSLPEVLAAASGVVERLGGLQDSKTGEAGGWEYAHAALFAKFSYLVQEQDSKLASAVLRQADKAWRYAEKNKKAKEESRDLDYRILAAAELYRASGQYKYRSIVEEYGKNASASGNKTVSGNQASDQKKTSITGSVSGNNADTAATGEALLDERDREEYLARITYLSTRRKVDLELCSQFMKELMTEAENITAQASRSPYLSAADGTWEGIDRLMWNMTVLSVVDYVITNHEYGQILENQHHYLCGRNPEGHVYWLTPDMEQPADDSILLTDEPAWTAGYLLMLSSILSRPEQ